LRVGKLVRLAAENVGGEVKVIPPLTFKTPDTVRLPPKVLAFALPVTTIPPLARIDPELMAPQVRLWETLSPPQAMTVEPLAPISASWSNCVGMSVETNARRAAGPVPPVAAVARTSPAGPVVERLPAVVAVAALPVVL
jgi:hypothetical protein